MVNFVLWRHEKEPFSALLMTDGFPQQGSDDVIVIAKSVWAICFYFGV